MKLAIVVFLVISVPIAGVVYSHSGATGIVKKRMEAMKDMGNKTKIVADMFKGRAEFEKDAVLEAADSYLLHGADIVELFPDTKESRTGSSTEALSRIWKEWEDFSEEVAEFVTAAELLQSTALSTDDFDVMKNAFRNTSKQCFDCHKRYRKPKD